MLSFVVYAYATAAYVGLCIIHTGIYIRGDHKLSVCMVYQSGRLHTGHLPGIFPQKHGSQLYDLYVQDL